MDRTDHLPSQSDVDDAAADERRGPNAAYAEIQALAQDRTSRDSFMIGAMRCIAGAFGSPYAALHVRYASEVVQDDWHTGSTDPKFWGAGLQSFLTDSLAEPKPRAQLLRSKTGTATIAFISAPVVEGSGSPIGAVALVLAPAEEDRVPVQLAVLEGLVRLASGYAAQPETSATSTETTGASHQALARAASYITAEQLAFAITNDLRNKAGCEQVALALVEQHRVKILSISGLDHVPRRSPGVVVIRAAMEECLDANQPIVSQDDHTWSSEQVGTGHRLHRQWRAAAKGDVVASIPLQMNDRPAAILSLRRRRDEPFTNAQIEDLRARVEPFIPAVALVQRAGRGLIRHARDVCRGIGQALTSRGRWGVKTATILAVIAAGVFAFGRMDYELTVPGTLAPAQIRHLAAPFDGVLASAFVVEGDRVSQGDILCQLDRRELLQQRAEFLAEVVMYERMKDAAMAGDKPVDVQLALAQRDLAQTKLDIVEGRIEQATVRAPVDGVVITGDLRKQIGSVVARGDPLFAVAPLDEWTVELAIPDHVVAELTGGLAGTFASHARPEAKHRFTISRVLSEAELRGEKNVYVAEASVGMLDDRIKPGMEGVARIELGSRRVWWVTLHRVIDYFHLHFWL